MKLPLKEIQLLFTRLSIALLFYPLSKILFFLYNHSYFSDVSDSEFIYILFCGLRFDISALLLMNAPFILLHIIPFGFTKRKWYYLMMQFIFLIINSFSILANCVDSEYYKFTLKRTTADFFHLFGLGSDIGRVLPQYIKDFWYVILLWIALTILLMYLYNKTKSIKTGPASETKGKTIASWLIAYSLVIGLFVIGIRGGLQLRPIVIINASEYVAPKNIPLIINTPFSIIKSYGLEELDEKKYFSEAELKKDFDPIQKPVGNRTISNQGTQINIFLIILESFSKEYIGSLSKRKSYTPFLDSLIKEGLIFDNAFANGKKSIDGIPAILGGLPSLMNESYITSSYGSNQFTSLANTLKERGYSSVFFHGGTNGTMGFDAFSTAAGFDNYIGRFEYNNENDYDGDWGIWDEPFFQFCGQRVSHMKGPFLAALFSLTSHHPYSVPDKYKRRFAEGELPIHKSIAYTDFSLRKFFDSARKEKWFDNTLFVITADHTGPSNDSYYSNSVGSFEIPILFYKHNSDLKGVDHKITQHIDIQPTVLSYLNYEKEYFSFGNNALDSAATGYAVNFFNDIYQIIQDDYCLQFDGTKVIGLYNYRSDSLLQDNLAGKNPAVQEALEKKLKAIVQTYNYGMIHNALTAKQP